MPGNAWKAFFGVTEGIAPERIGAMILLVIPAALLLYLFLTAPGHRAKKHVRAALPVPYYAHRGLHGGQIPENSLPAFERAAQNGYGIELDVRLTRDGEIVVHHDETLKRMCGVDRRVSDLALDEILSLRLRDTSCGIPTLDAVCSLVNGRVPLLIEMKSDRGNGDLPKLLYSRMKEYKGIWCVESFDPRMLLWFRLHAREVIRGQLAVDLYRSEGNKGLLFRAAAHLLMDFLSRPDFIAYGYLGGKNPSFRFVRRLFRPVAAAWTVKSPDESRKLEAAYDVQIFEGFCPDMKRSRKEETEQ